MQNISTIYSMWFTSNLISKETLKMMVANKKISEENYFEITNEDYVAPTVTSVITQMNEKISNNEFAINLTGAAVVDRIEDIEGKINT